MSHKQPLKRRIVIAFFLMTLVVGGTSSISIFFIVQTIEEHFVSQQLGQELDEILQNNENDEQFLTLRKGGYFYAPNLIPEEYRELKEGFSEVFSEKGGAFYAFKRTINHQSYLIIQDQTEFETREHRLFFVVALGFIGSLIISWILGSLLANQIMAPVKRLASQVNSLNEQEISPQALSEQYADDEVGQLASAFDRAIKELYSSLERERFFTSDVSHELRTPLMVIATSCELLTENHDLSPKLQTQIDRISRANKAMNDLVQTFLVLARSQTEDIIGEKGTLTAIAQEQSKDWQLNFAEKGIKFTFKIQSQNATIYNVVLLKAVISNLLRNAYHYTEQGEVTLLLDNNSFSIEDTGIGIPEDQQNLIFQPFVRGTTTRGEGLGLGLSLIKRICAHQGWEVKVTSKPTVGSIFQVNLQPSLSDK